MVNIHIDYEGNLRCRALHEPSGAEILTDAPVDNRGKGEAFSPTDLVATALGSCIATIMGIVAERHEIDLTGMRVDVVKEMATEPTRRIGRLRVALTMPHNLPEEQRTILRRAAEGCPVARSLHPDVRVDFSIEYPDAAGPA